MSTLRFAAIGSLLFGFHAAAVAQQLGYISALVVPLLADTESYQTQIFVHNLSTTQISVQFRYVGGTTSVTPGPRSW